MDVVVLLHASKAALDLVGVEYGDDMALAVALIVAQQVAQGLSGAVQTVFGNGFQLVPGENDVVAIHQQVFFSPELFPDGPLFRLIL